jgi:hypothetical protein
MTKRLLTLLMMATSVWGAGSIFSQSQEAILTGTNFGSLLGPGAGSLTLPANFFNCPGKALHFHISGYYQTDSNIAALLFVVALGSTQAGVSQTFVVPPNAIPPQNQQLSPIYPMFTIDGYVTAITTGTNGTMNTSGIVTFTSNVSSAPTVIGLVGIHIPVDTTQPQIFNIIGQWSRTGEGLQSLNAVLD